MLSDEQLTEIQADYDEHCPILFIPSGEVYVRQVARAIRADAVMEDHCDIVELVDALVEARARIVALTAAGGAMAALIEAANGGCGSTVRDAWRALTAGREGP